MATVTTTRVNLALDPAATALTNWGNLGSTTTTRSTDTVTFHSGTTSYKTVYTSAGTGGSKGTVSNPGFVTGDTIKWSVWVYPSKTITIQPYWERTSPTYTGGSGGSAVSCPANTWTKLTGSVTLSAAQADSTSTGFGFGFLSTVAWAINDVTYSDELVVERTTSLGTYFDGDTTTVTDNTFSPAATRSYSWSGAINASTSLETLSVPLQDYQIELPDGTILGAGTTVGLLEVTGLRGSAETRAADYDRGGVDGMSPGMSLLTGRAMDIKWLITDQTSAEQALQQLVRNWQNIPEPSSVTMSARDYLMEVATAGPREHSALRIQLPGRPKPFLVFGRPERLDPPVNSSYAAGWIEVGSGWFNLDGKVYDNDVNTVDAALPASTGGASFPWSFPVNFGPSTGGTVSVQNGGLYPAKPVFRINGPITNPMISDSVSGKFVRVNLTLLQGDVLIIDSDSRVVRLNGVNRNNVLDTGSSFFAIPPGGTSLTFSSTDVAGSSPGSLTVYTLNTYSTA